jgi:cellulose synthase/poly-beta-1,6-N-acetylglucosamine synthase-like glycosyltransferase
MVPDDDERPFITVQLPVYNEFYVVERLIDGCCALDYPRDRFEIQVLDDSTDATSDVITAAVRRHAAAGIQISHVRRPDRHGFKGGNLQHGLATARGSLVAIFDADFVPDRNFLLRTVAYFRDPAVGIVYPRFVRHRNRDYSALTRAQDPFGGRPVPPGDADRYHSSRFFNYFFGSPGLVRVTCLDDVGGWHGDTLCEDADFSLRAYMKGWRCVLVDERLSTDDVQERMDEIKHQTIRWKTGNAECYRKHAARVLRCPGLTPLQRLSIFAALHAPWLHIPAIAIIALTSVPLLFHPVRGVLSQAALVLPSVLGTVWLLTAVVTRNRAVVMSLLLQIGLYPRVTWGIIKGLLGIRTEFTRSTKRNSPAARTGPDLYPIRATPGILLEGGLVLYFLFAVVAGLQMQEYRLLPFHVLCACSFGWVFAVSVREVRLETGIHAHRSRP